MNTVSYNLPDSTTPSGSCTRCGEPDTTFDVNEQIFLALQDYEVLHPDGSATRHPGEWVTILTCRTCNGRIVVIEKFGRRFELAPQSRESTPKPVEEKDSLANLDELIQLARKGEITAAKQNAEVFWHGVQYWPPAPATE